MNNGQKTDGLLVLLPCLRAPRLGRGTFGLTKKFVDGVSQYLEYWNGPVRVLVEPSVEVSNNLDNVTVVSSSLGFETQLVEFEADRLRPLVSQASMVHAAASYRQNDVSTLCNDLGVPCVYSCEYSLKTRLQIVRANTKHPIVRVRRYLWEWQQERRQRLAISRAIGVQCNGTPAFESYRNVNANPLLYFDTRATREMLLPRPALERRLETLRETRPLRLAFSGRLDAMKGVQHLPALAQQLMRRGVDFRLTVCGAGELEGYLRNEFSRLGLARRVHMAGVKDFKSELMPFMRSDVDLFVCPHVQGDPSCTYLETMACGLPIVGFANEALSGIVSRARVGWTIPIGRVRRMAALIEQLAHDRTDIARRSRAAREVAREHTFESTFEARVDHMRYCMDLATPASRSVLQRKLAS